MKLNRITCSIALVALLLCQGAAWAEDNYAPNYTFETAYDLTGDSGIWLSAIKGWGQPYADHDDYYKVVLPAHCGSLVFDLDYDKDEAGLYLSLYADDAEHTPIDCDYTCYLFTAAEVDRFFYVKTGKYVNHSLPLEYNLKWMFDDNRERYDSLQSADFTFSPSDGEQWSDLCQSDEDWYKISVPSELHRQLRVDCTFTDMDGDINLEIYDTNGVMQVRANTTSNNEQIWYTVPTAGDYYIRVYGENRGNFYSLIWTANDWYEDNDSKADAYDITGLEGQWLSSDNGMAINLNHDYDYYRFEITNAPCAIQVDALWPTNRFATDDIAFALFNEASDQSLAYPLPAGENVNYLNYQIPTNGTYFIQVRPPWNSDNHPTSYDLRWAFEDVYEANDTMETATPLAEHSWLSTLQGPAEQLDDDFYKVILRGHGGTLVVDCEFTDADGDIELELYNSSGTLQASSRSVSDNELLSTGLPAGTYYIRVYGASIGGNTGNEYDLRWRRDDWFEENDSRTTAFNLSSSPWVWLSDLYDIGQQCDADYYKIEVTSNAARRVIAECSFTHADGDIDLILLDSNGDTVTSRTSSSDNESLDYTVPAIGTYYLLVQGDNAGNSYDLRWKPISPGDDYYEDNDTLSTAYDLTDIEGDWLSDHHGEAYKKDAEWYKITVPADAHRVWTRLQCYDADLDMSLYDSTGDELAWTQGNYADEFINQIVLASGTYYIEVTGPDSGAEYDLFWSVHPAADDVYEENDTPVPSVMILHRGNQLAYIGGTGINNDDDYYRMYVYSGYEQVQIDGSFSTGDITLSINDSSGQWIPSLNSTLSSGERLQTVLSPGMYYIRVNGDNSGSTYDLSWNGSASTAPTDITITSTTVDENQSAGTVIGRLDSVDSDTGDVITFSLLSTPDSAWFQVNGQNLETKTSFDYENNASYSLTIKATDRSGKWITEDFTITINDLSEAPPAFSSATATPNGLVMKWQSSTGTRYQILSTTNLLDGFSSNGIPVLDATPPENCHTGLFNGASTRFWKITETP